MSKILPKETELSTPYWQGCRDGVLYMQSCDGCGLFQFYPRTICSHCGDKQLQWLPVSGRGRVLSFSVVRRGISPAYEAPYVVALIALEDGPTMMSGIQTQDPATVRVGARVEVVFESWDEEVAVPMFKTCEE